MLGTTEDKSVHKVRVTKSVVKSLREEILQYMDGGGYLAWSEKDHKYLLLGTNSPRTGLVNCPECGIGRLMVIRSRATGKRFIGCSNYAQGCTATSPLLQRARLRAIKQSCPECGWPIVLFRYSRDQKWSRQCSNISCTTRNKG